MKQPMMDSHKLSYFTISFIIIAIVILLNYAGEAVKQRNINNIISACDSGMFVVDSAVIEDPTGTAIVKIDVNETNYVIFDINPDKIIFKNKLKSFRCFKSQQ